MTGTDSTTVPIQKALVIGAGTMGASIAAHLSNVGLSVTLLDVTREKAIEGLEKVRTSNPPGFMTHEALASIHIGAVHEEQAAINAADWICEAIVERIEPKKQLWAFIGRHANPNAILTTNTSSLPIKDIVADASFEIKRRFMGAHFFNPPRYLKLLELIPGEDTDPDEVDRLRAFLENQMGRRVIIAKDTPGFIANRFGMWAQFHAIHVAERLQLSVEQVDLIAGTFLGRPKSGVFRLADIIGLDVMNDIATSIKQRCPDETCQKVFTLPRSVQMLLSRNWIGEKVGQGYYRKEAKEFFALDLNTTAYRMTSTPDFRSLEELDGQPLKERLSNAFDLKDEVGEFLRGYLIPLLKYAVELKEEISYSVEDFDNVMRWGFGWQIGPFELIDAIGASKLGIEASLFYSKDQVRSFSGQFVPLGKDPRFQALTEFPVIDEYRTLRLRDIGHGVIAVGLTTKMGIITPNVVNELTTLLEKKALNKWVLTSEAKCFSVGYDIEFLLACILENAHETIALEIGKLHRLGALIEQTESVATLFNYSLGAGLELAMSCRSIVADAEAKIGLPEAKIGLIPGGRGTVLHRMNCSASAKQLAEGVVTLASGKVAGSAVEAQALGYLTARDQIVFNPDLVLSQAKHVLLTARPQEPRKWTTAEGPIVGMADRALAQAKAKGELTDYDVSIGDRVKAIFAKCPTMEAALEKEMAEFFDLCTKSFTQLRIRHMSEVGKPLRN